MPRSTQTTGQILANLRHGKGLTQQRLADQIGISRAHLSNLEKDRSKPSNGVLTAIAKVLEIEGNVLLDMLTAGGPKPPPPRPRYPRH